MSPGALLREDHDVGPRWNKDDDAAAYHCIFASVTGYSTLLRCDGSITHESDRSIERNSDVTVELKFE